MRRWITDRVAVGKGAAALTAAVTMTAVLALASPALQAADLGGRAPPPDYYDRPPLDIERWTGFYLGGALGHVTGTGRSNGDFGHYIYDQSGTIGSLYAGTNWQIGRAVLGVEADISTGSLQSDGIVYSELNAMGSFRGRAGVLLTPSLLLYGTAGLAWANMDFGIDGVTSESKTFWGYQVGVGTEFMVSRNVGLRLEYIHTDLGREHFVTSGFANAYRPEFDTVRAGVTFKF